MTANALPLAGHTVLITRARAQAVPLSEQIRRLGGEPWLFPVIATVPTAQTSLIDEAIAQMDSYRFLVFTSANGVSFFIRRFDAVGLDPAVVLAPVRLVAVGAATGRALTAWGLTSALVPGEYRGASLPALLAPHIREGDRVLMARGDLADPAHAAGVSALGADVHDLVVYRTVIDQSEPVSPLREALRAGRVDYVTFTSGSTVKHLLTRLGGPELLRSTRIACIGAETSKVVAAAGLTVAVMPTRSTAEALAEALAIDVERRHR